MRRLIGFALCALMTGGVVHCESDPAQSASGTMDTPASGTPIRGEMWFSCAMGGTVSGSAYAAETAFTALGGGAELFIVDNLSVGPELGIYIDGDPLLFFGLNLGYTHWIAERKGPFIHAGYGIANDFGNEKLSHPLNIFTAGAGMKFPLGSKSLFRVELLYKHLWQKTEPFMTIAPQVIGPDFTGSGYPEYRKRDNIGVLVGLSVPLR